MPSTKKEKKEWKRFCDKFEVAVEERDIKENSQVSGYSNYRTVSFSHKEIKEIR